MFNIVGDKRKFDTPGDIIDFNAINEPVVKKEPEPVKKKDGDDDPPPPSPTDDLVEVDNKTNPILKDVISTKYEDLTTVRLNKTGDLVNIEGAVLISKDDLDKSVDELKTQYTNKAKEYIKTLKTVEIEGVEHTIGEDGSVKDKDGNILLSAEDLLNQVLDGEDYLKDDTDDDISDSIYEQANSITGLTFQDENGNPVSFEETPQGLAQRDLYIARTEGLRVARENIDNFFNNYPDLLDAFYYMQTRGSLNGYGSQTTHEGIEIKEDNEDAQTQVVLDAEMKRGYTREQAMKRVKLYKDNDMLYEESKSSLEFLVNSERKEKADRKTAYENEQARKAQEQEDYWNNVAAKLEAGKILDYTIPDQIRIALPNGTIKYSSKQDFFDYLSVPVKNNKTQAQLDAEKESIDNKIFNDYLRYVGYNMGYIVEQRVKQKQVLDMKQRFSKGVGSSNRKLVIANAKKNDDKIVYGH